MSTHNICLYKEVDKKYTGCNLKTAELLDCALIGVCVVISSNTVCGTKTALVDMFCKGATEPLIQLAAYIQKLFLLSNLVNIAILKHCTFFPSCPKI